MSVYRRRTLALLTAFWIALLAATWFLLAPVQVGGQASYVIIAGQSMEPNFHFGDLVIVHKASDYQVGDVVAYQNADIGRYVIHRIIDKNRGRFVLKGDNNTWVDGYEPASQEVLGKLWVRLPKFGTYMQKLREPVYMALFAGLIGSVVAGSVFGSKKRENQRMEKNPRRTELNWRPWLSAIDKKIHLGKLKEKFSLKRQHGLAKVPEGQNRGQKSGQQRSTVETLFFTLAVVAFLSIMLGFISFTRPATQVVSDDVNYQHLGFFSYSALAPAGIYDSETIQSGDPVFPNLTCSININFNYTLVAESVENMGGVYQLNAILTHPQSGWQRTIPLQEQKPFAGNAFNTQAALNLCEIVNLVESVEEITSVRAGAYMVAISPRVQVTGLVAGRPLDTTFDPQLVFQYDRAQFYLTRQDEESNPLNPVVADILHEEKNIPNTLTFFGTELNVPVLRAMSVIGLLLSLSGLAFLWLQLEHIARNDQESFVRIKYDPLVIDVEENSLPNSQKQLVNVNSIDDLAKLAEKHNTLILHRSQESLENYFVNVDGLSYIYSQVKRGQDGFSRAIEEFHLDLRGAFDRGEFQVYYQPIISLVNGQVTAVEALLRWQHPQLGMIPAGEFIQMAEKTGDIGRLDEWVMQVACTQLKRWQDAGVDLKLALNLSKYNLDREPVELIQRVLNATHTNPGWLQIEVPEAKIAAQTPGMLLQLQKLKEMGIHITLDDFAGQVALSSISHMPVSSVKLDQMLVKKLSDPAEAIAMKRMIAVATTLGLSVVGKGVETDEEKAFLANEGSQAQGYLLGRPVPAQEIAELIRSTNPPAEKQTRRKRPGREES
jgi:signal peptidase I